ncbi:MAG: YidC/Oxa1 family membrane protein insertase [Coriobacteriales bacterium]|nr:YidC/Oxa1 family membrane protein insertase [Coriobacteriales bacterium]
MWEAFINLLTQILSGIYGFCGDWGLAIIILTLIVRLLIMPLMTRSTKSSAKMQVLQPQMQALQERYADDPETLQREMSKFYAENKFNPLGGCLPILLQMPIFIALFSVIRNIEFISGGAASFYNIVPDLAVGPAQVIAQSGIPAAAIYIFLDVLFGLLTLIPLMLNTQAGTDPQQQRTSRIMGVFMAVWMVWIGWNLPSGVLLYYNTSALWQVAQQQLITKRVINEAKAQAEAQMANRPIEVEVVRKDRKKRPHKKS